MVILIFTILISVIEDNSELNQSIDRITGFMATHNLMVYNSLQDYEDKRESKRRLLIIIMTRLCLLISFFKWLVSAILIDNRSVTIAVANPAYMVGDLSIARLFTVVVTIASFNALISLLIVDSLELRHTFHPILSFLSGFRRRAIPALNNIDGRRFALRMNLMSKMLYPAYWLIMIQVETSAISLLISAYLDPGSGFPLSLCLVWLAIFTVVTTQMSAFISWAIVVTTFCVLYLKSKFSEVAIKVMVSVRSKRCHQLMAAMAEHKAVEEQTRELNRFYSPILFVIYFLITPMLTSFLQLVQSSVQQMWLRIVVAICMIILAFTMVSINLFTSQISDWSQKPYKYLFSMFCRNTNRMSIHQKLRIIAFIETLSESHIGFTCGGLFRMSKLQFIQYLAYLMSNYMLLSKK